MLEPLSVENCFFEIIQVLYEVNIMINLKQLCFFTTVSEYVHAFKVSCKNITLLKGYKVYTIIDHMQLCTTVISCSFIYLLSTYLLSVFYVPGIILGTGYTVVNKVDEKSYSCKVRQCVCVCV